MLSEPTRLLLRASAVLLGIFGVVSFVAPGWAADNFPWSVRPAVAMALGGWGIGSAVMAWEAARIGRLSAVYPILVFLWVFAVLELVVAVAFAHAFVTDLLAWPYALGLLTLAASGVVGVVDIYRRRLPVREETTPIPLWVRVVTVLFVIFVTFLAFSTATAPQGGGATEGAFFPDKMTLFTVRAFSAFFTALVLAALSMLAARSLRPYLELARTGSFLTLPLAIAGVANLDKFDFANRPGGLVYLGAYVGVFVIAVVALWMFRQQGWRLGTAGGPVQRT